MNRPNKRSDRQYFLILFFNQMIIKSNDHKIKFHKRKSIYYRCKKKLTIFKSTASPLTSRITFALLFIFFFSKEITLHRCMFIGSCDQDKELCQFLAYFLR